MISNKKIDSIYNGAIKNGTLEENFLVLEEVAFLYFVLTISKTSIDCFFKIKKIRYTKFRFEPEGLKTWTSRGSSGF